MTVALLLLFFAPLAAVYGLRRARRRLPQVAGRAGLVGLCARMLVFPAFVFVALMLALADLTGTRMGEIAAILRWRTDGAVDLAEPTGIYTGNGVIDFVLWLVLSFGKLMLILFFLSVPYVMGNLIAVLLLLADRSGWTSVLRRPGIGEQEPPDMESMP